MIRNFILILSLLLFPCKLLAQSKEPAAKPPLPTKQEIKQDRIKKAPSKNRVWSLELAILRYIQKIEPGHALNGYGGRVSLGYGVITKRHFILGDFSLYIGPFGKSYSTAQYDYTGNGASVTLGSTFDTMNMRGDDMGIGILGGLGFQSFTGRFYGRNDAENPVPPSTAGIVTLYNNTLSSADVNIGVFTSMLKVQRPDTHDTENLVTRNEGIILSFQASLPVWSRFRGQYQILDANQNSSPVVETGMLEGFKFILSLRAFLGS